MKVILTGAAGYIGAHISAELLNNSHEVIGIDNFSTGRKEFLDPRIEFYEGDISDQKFLNSVFANLKSENISGVIHAAGLKFAGESVKDPTSYYMTNAAGTASVLKAMEINQIHNLVFSSSCSVYGAIKDSKPVRECDEYSPVSPYGRSKMIAELMIKDAIDAGIATATCLRYFNVAGNSDISALDTSQFNLFPNLYRAISEKKVFSIFGGSYDTPDGTCVRDYVDVVQLAKVHVTCLKMLDKGDPLSFAYNLGSGHGASVQEIVQAAKTKIEPSLNTERVSARIGDPSVIMANTTLAEAELGWEHNSSIEQLVLDGWSRWQKSRTN